MAMLYAARRPGARALAHLYAGVRAQHARPPDYPAAWSAEERAVAMRTMVENWGEGDFASRFALPRPRRQPARLARPHTADVARPARRRAMELNGRLDVRHVLGTIRVPTLLLHRTGDVGIGVAHSRFLADHIPGARLVELDGIDTRCRSSATRPPWSARSTSSSPATAARPSATACSLRSCSTSSTRTAWRRRARRRDVARPARRARPPRAGQPRPPPRPRDQVRRRRLPARRPGARRPCGPRDVRGHVARTRRSARDFRTPWARSSSSATTSRAWRSTSPRG